MDSASRARDPSSPVTGCNVTVVIVGFIVFVLPSHYPKLGQWSDTHATNVALMGLREDHVCASTQPLLDGNTPRQLPVHEFWKLVHASGTSMCHVLTYRNTTFFNASATAISQTNEELKVLLLLRLLRQLWLLEQQPLLE